MPQSYLTDDICFTDIQDDLKSYSLSKFRQDFLAGLTVALLTLPQAMAYALLAGLPLSCGLLAAIYSSIVAALFGSSRQLVAGPSNAIAILISAGTSEILYTYYRDLVGYEREIVAVQILTQITFLAGMFQIVAAWCRLGRVTQFVSQSVVVGYVTGTALAVIISQLFNLFGIARMTGVHSLYEHALYFIAHLHHTQWTTALVGVASIAILLCFKKINNKFPVALLTFIIAAIAVEFLGLSSYSGSSALFRFDLDGQLVPNVLVVGDTGEVSDIFPLLDFPFFNMRIINGVLPVAFAIALLSVMDTISVAKTIAASTGQRLSLNQEIFGVGLGNIVSSFIGAMPVSGSPSRSCLNHRSGAQTRFAAILNALFVSVFIVALSFFVTRIPLATLSALVLVSAVKIVNTKQLLFCLRTTPSDAFVLWATLLSCLFFSLDVAFYIGVALSITLYLKKSAVPHLAEYEMDETGELHQLEEDDHHAKAIRLIKVEGELFFGAADLFQSTLRTMTADDKSTKVIILQLKNARDIDATTCFALKQLHDNLQSTGMHLIACGMTKQVWEVFHSSGLVQQIGQDNLFAFDFHYPNEHMIKAMQRAKSIIIQTQTVTFVSSEGCETGTEPIFQNNK